MDLLRPLGLAGVPCATVAGARDPTRYSRLQHASVARFDASAEPQAQIAALLAFGTAQPGPPSLFYERDAELLMVSRSRAALATCFRFVIADPDLVEDLVDKARFQVLARDHELPVPRSHHLRPADEPLTEHIELPLLVKPLIRDEAAWSPFAAGAKARRVATRTELRDLCRGLANARIDVLAQELVPGPESRIESYHVYVDNTGEVAGEFTGRKIRTHPAAYGYSTAVETTDAPDVALAGRDVVRRLELRGVAKLDFKRRPDGTLALLEINPRFNLWHHVGAVAGVNLPALVHADLAGLPRPPVRRARAGATWSMPWEDLKAVRHSGGSVLRWTAWIARCDAVSTLAWDDPLPFARGHLWPWARQRFRQRIF
jgi:predicted ATP-grasp superfamily ATP-dependent carboligase